jgi:tetratricopeptide (TPR) repeat protein
MFMTHTFIPAEGGEAAIGAEYGDLLEALANDALEKGKTEDALKYYIDACNSPLSIGGGFLHEVNKVPYKYGQAQCLFKLNRKKEAEEALAWILDFPVDYFTQSMLPSFHYYRGMALMALGRKEEGKAILTKMKQNAERELGRKEYGQFASTSAYSSYIRNPAEQRNVHYSALLALAEAGLNK